VVTDPVAFYQNVSPSKELRDASNEAEQLVLDFGVESSMRIDVYNAEVAAQKNIEASGKELNPEELRLVEKMIQDGTRAGLALPEADRERLTVWKKELSQLCLEFSVSIFQPDTLWMSTLLIGYRKTSTRRM
jgi:Zn-dependent oligopeptidase